MATQVTERHARVSHRSRPIPPILDGKGTQGAANILIVDPDERRRARARKALATVPAELVTLARQADAYVEAHNKTFAVAIVDGREAPEVAVEFLTRLRQSQPFVVSVIVGIEGSAGAMLAAVNEIGAYRVLPRNATELELRAAAIGALRLERDRRFHARLDRHWVRGLLGKIEAAIPVDALSDLDARGGELPFDLVTRPDSNVHYRGDQAL
jgi:DNA-binding NtrC family response regulator